MWKKTFIRFGIVLLVATVGVLVVAANNKVVKAKKECAENVEKCALKADQTKGDFIIWESLSRTVLSAVQY